MKGKYRRTLLSLLSAVILFISVTYAWILNNGVNTGRFVIVDFRGQGDSGKLSIVSAEVHVELLYQDADGNYQVKADDGTPLELSNMVPNDMRYFKIRFYNLTGESQTVSLSISGIITDSLKIMQEMYIGITGGTGYADTTDANVVKPDTKFLCLSDAKKRTTGEEYDMKLYNAMIIPPTTADTYVEINGFFWLDREAKIELAGKTLTITNFRVLI